MRKLATAGALLVLALVAQGCGGDSSSPTEPGRQTARGNWVGTINGTHAGIRLQGTCDLEMLLDPNLNSGRWWIDCPNGGSSQGQVIGATSEAFAVLALLPLSPATNCPFTLVGTRTTATVEGNFEVTDCNTDAVLSTGAFRMRLR